MRKTLSFVLALVMTLTVMSGMILFESSAALPAHSVEISIPGFNQYTPAQMEKMAIKFGEDYEFSKDDDNHTVISANCPQVDDGYGTYQIAFATAETYDQWQMNKLIDGLSVFGDVDLSNKLGFAFKIHYNGKNQFSDVSFCFGSSTKKIAVDFRKADYDAASGYYYVNWAKTGWYGTTIQGDDWWKDCPTIQDMYFRAMDQFQIRFYGEKGKHYEFYIEDMFAYANVDTTELQKAYLTAKDAKGFPENVLDEAIEMYKDKTIKNQQTIDDEVAKIYQIIEESSAGVDAAREKLNSLLDEADMLGYFESDSEYYDLACEADLVCANTDATAEELNRYVVLLRDVIYAEYMDEDLISILTKLDNLWKYNYTEASYKNAKAVCEEVWETYEDDEEAALAKAQAAYDALVKVAVTSVTNSLFSDWSAADVNDVVDANSEKLCDSIGDGLNTPDVWNSGDFSRETTFDAGDGWFSMTAETDFTDGSMGWKNMDRSGTLAAKKNEGYPALTTTGLAKAEGIRFKLTVDGRCTRILVGLSNCADLTREMYVTFITPNSMDDEGYITLPWDAFQAAWWSTKFGADELEKIIVFITEAYGATDGTSVTIEDIKGYASLTPASGNEMDALAAITDVLVAFDVDARYAELAQQAQAFIDDGGYSYEVNALKKEIQGVLAQYKDPDGVVVDVPGFSIYTEEELAQFTGRSTTWKPVKTDRGIIPIRKTGTSGEMVNGLYAGSGYTDGDVYYGALDPIGGKNFIDMLGGYNLTQIYAFRFKIDGGSGSARVNYKEGGTLYKSLNSNKHEAALGKDGYYTFYMSEVPLGGLDGWDTSHGTTQDEIRENAKYIIYVVKDGHYGKEIYGWQVLLSEPVYRTDLKKVIEMIDDQTVVADALELYYNDEATQQQIDDFVAPYLKEINKPDAPVIEVTELTATKAVVTAIKGVEYKLGEGKWSTSNVFEGLTPETKYTVFARYPETDETAASDEASVSFTTAALSFGDAAITIEGTAKYGETLVATAQDIPEELEGHTSIEWRADGKKVADGDQFEIADAALIGKAVVAVLVSDLFDGEVESDATALIAKGTPEIITMPNDAYVVMGAALSTCEITGGEASVPGTWKYAKPELVLDLQQDGMSIDVYFIPDDSAAYENVKVSIQVFVLADTEEKVLTNDELGITLKGEFFNQAVTGDTVAFEAINPGTVAYLDLLRAAKYSDTENNMIFMYAADFGASPAYKGTLELTTKVNAKYAGEEYTFWFFADGEITSYTAVVEADGTVTISGLIL